MIDDDDDDDCGETGGIKIGRGNRSTRRIENVSDKYLPTRTLT
jgi:hypothetical protein